MAFDPFDIIYNGNFDENFNSKNVYSAAIDEMLTNYQPEKILKLLQANKPSLIMDGLYIMSEVGDNTYDLLWEAIVHINHQDWRARFHIADIYLLFLKKLQCAQITQILPLCNDEHIAVREKMMRFLSLIKLSQLESAIEFINSDKQDLFQKCLNILKGEIEQNLTDLIKSEDLIIRCFAGAAIIKTERTTDFQFELDASFEEEKYIIFERRLKLRQLY